ncbi:MAG: NAD(P)H-dependent oxidoreductase [Trueperella sp.]|nr:NAD(P)H-dependent oxidoreductase [Trueperella sp.]
MKQLVVVSASLSENSSADRLGQALSGAVVERAQAEVQVTHVSLRNLAHGIVDAMLTGFPGPELEAAFDAVAAADAVIAVTPAYNASYSGLFKSFWDVLPEETMRGKPVALGATGGTPRHSLITEHALRPMFSYLHAVVMPTALYVATEDFGHHAADSDASGGATLNSRVARAASELARYLMPATGAAVADDAESNGAADPEPESGASEDARDFFPDFRDFTQLQRARR